MEDQVVTVAKDKLNEPPELDESLYKAYDNVDGFLDSDDLTLERSQRDEAKHEWIVKVSYIDRAGNESLGEFLITVKEKQKARNNKNNTDNNNTNSKEYNYMGNNMNTIVEFLINLMYCCSFLCIGHRCFEFDKRNFKHEKIFIVLIILIVTILWEYLNIGGRWAIHFLSIAAILLSYFNENWKIIIPFYFGAAVILSLLEMVMQVLLFGILSYLNINILEKQVILIVYIILLLFIWILGGYFSKKYPGRLRNIGIGYWIVFVIILFFDALVLVVLGDFIKNIFVGSRAYVDIFSYCCIVIGLLIQLVLLINTLVTRNVYKENEKLAKQFLESQKEHYQYLEKREHETKKFRHDIKNHLMLLENLIVTQKYDDAQEYLNTISEKVTSFSNQISVNNGIADAILNRFYMEAEEQGIVLKVKGHFPMNCNISAYDICTILSNVLSNAIQAEREAGGDEVLVSIRYTENEVLLSVENDYAHKLEEVGGVYRTTKKDNVGHGYGLSSVKDCVERNGGTLSISTENQRFKILIMIMKGNEGSV